MDRYLQVLIEPLEKAAASTSFNCRVKVRAGDGQIILDRETTVAPLTDHEETELSWYLESYAQIDSFSTSRAHNALIRIRDYTRQLIRNIFGKEHESEEEWSRKSFISVVVKTTSPGSSAIHSIHWELLESIDFWNPATKPAEVAVTRQVASVQSPRDADIAVKHDGTNILLLSARPQLDQDVPHRLVSNALISVLERLPEEERRTTQLTMVRPGTFSALQDILSNHPYGHFDIVHLDLHGYETPHGIALAFLDLAESGIQADYVYGEALASSMANKGVPTVVMSACRSARGRNWATGLAETLIGAGIQTVIGMAFDALASSVETFMTSLYRAILDQRLPSHAACHVARLELAGHSTKTTRFGTEVDIEDALVPICYLSSSSSANISVEEFEEFRSRSISNVRYLELGSSKRDLIFGRENDLLLLETHFIQSTSNVAILEGPAGAGKSELLKHACNWWLRTGFVESSATIDFTHLRRTSTDFSFRQTVRNAMNLNEASSWDVVVEHINTHRICLGLEGLECIAHLESRSCRSLRQEIKSFLRSIAAGRSIALIASRRNESWASSTAYVHQVKGLSPAAALQYIGALCAKIGLDLTENDAAQLRYLDHIANLVQRNPLALEAVFREVQRRGTDLRSFFFLLVAGVIRLEHSLWSESKGAGARSIQELSEIILCLDFKHKLDIMEHRGAGDQVRDIFNCELILKPIQGFNLPEDAVTPFRFGLFWSRIPVHSMTDFLIFHNFTEAPALEAMRHLLATHPQCPMPTEDVAFRMVSDHADRSAAAQLKTMRALGYISLKSEQLADSKNELYYEIHPLLTLMARSSLEFQARLEHLTEAMLLCQQYRLKRWPWKNEYGNPVWKEHLETAALEFTNNLCAAIVAGQRGYRSFWTFVGFERLMMSIQKSLVHSLERQDIVEWAWTDILNAMIDFPEEELYHEDSEYTDHELSALVGQTPSYTSEQVQEVKAHESMALFHGRRYLLGRLGGATIAWSINSNSGDTEELRSDVVSALNSELSSEHHTHCQDTDLANITLALKKKADYMLGFVLEVGTDRQYNAIRDGTYGKEILEMMRFESELSGAYDTPEDRYDFVPGQSRWEKIPIFQNPTSAIVMSFVQVKEDVEEHLKKGETSHAREAVSKALHGEINFRGNHTVTKVQLLELLARVNEVEENWRDALRVRRDAEELEDSITPRASDLKRLRRTLKIAKAAERAGRSDLLTQYITTALQLANEATTESSEIEAKAMQGLAELDIANSLDGPIAAVFLLIRGAKSRYRRDGPRSEPAEWFTLITEACNKHVLFSIAGPPNEKPQSVAIVNAITIFSQWLLSDGAGQGSNIILALYGWFSANNELEKMVQLYHELGERFFAGPGVEPYSHLCTPNLQFLDHNALFEHLYSEGRRYLTETGLTNQAAGFEFHEAPFVPTRPVGETWTSEYTFPTELMLRLAGYIV